MIVGAGVTTGVAAAAPAAAGTRICSLTHNMSSNEEDGMGAPGNCSAHQEQLARVDGVLEWEGCRMAVDCWSGLTGVRMSAVGDLHNLHGDVGLQGVHRRNDNTVCLQPNRCWSLCSEPGTLH